MVWKRKGDIQPRYAKPSQYNIEAATTLIEAYKAHIGEKKKTLKAVSTDLENKGFEYRFVRGLALLLDRRGTFICNSKLNPVELRRKIFEAAQKLGLPSNLKKRENILVAVALEMSSSKETVEESLYGDLDDELILEKFDAPLPVDLLEQYNLSLTQTLLFDSMELSFTTSGNWQNLFHFKS